MSRDLVEMVIEGPVVTKPTLRHINRGAALCKFGVLCVPQYPKKKTKDSEPMYFTVMVLGNNAEALYLAIKIGMPVRAEGMYNDGIYRDALTDEPKIGRVIYASKVRSFVYWKPKRISDKNQEMIEGIQKMKMNDELPF